MILSGHDEPWHEWRAAMAGPRMHHGWILAGKRGIGKASFAVAAARELVAQDGIAQPPGNHPDIIVLQPLPADKDEEKKRDEGKPYQRKRSIGVEQIRQMQHRLNTRPTLGARRVIVIDSADLLETASANALLKSLEEPPVGTFFMLVAHKPGSLLPTIRSRCRMLRFPDLAPDEIDRLLREIAPQADDTERAAGIAAAAGSPGAALDFLELGLGRVHQAMVEIARNGDADFALRGRLSAAMGARPDREKQLAALELARAVVAQRMEATPRGHIPTLVHVHSELARLTALAPTHNFDSGLLVLEIGGLLASLTALRDAADG